MKKTILVIEDDTRSMILVADLLECNGYHVLKATDGATGLKTAMEEIPDLVLLDIHLPVMDGYKVAETLRDNPQTKKIPVVVITASVLPTDQERIQAAGCREFIGKPFQIQHLLEVVRNYV